MRRGLAALSRAARAWGEAAAAHSHAVASTLPPLPAAHLQRAGLRTPHAGKPHLPHRRGRAPSRSLLWRSLAAAGKAAGVAVVGLPLAATAALVYRGREEGASAGEILSSLPRTLRVVWWGGWATLQYKALAARHAADPDSPAYQLALAELHDAAATKLLLAIQANGGIYIKARSGGWAGDGLGWRWTGRQAGCTQAFAQPGSLAPQPPAGGPVHGCHTGAPTVPHVRYAGAGCRAAG